MIGLVEPLRTEIDHMYQNLESQGRDEELQKLKELAEPILGTLQGWENHCFYQLVTGRRIPMDEKFKDRIKSDIKRLGEYMEVLK
jgi:hypothetical protein